MAQHCQSPASPTPLQPGLAKEEGARTDVAGPAPLGLNVLAFATAMFGCYSTGYIVPYETAGIRTALGAILLVAGIISALTSGGELHNALGLLFLCWAILTGVLILGALRTSASMTATMGVMFAAYVLLTIGQLAGDNVLLVQIGGWLAIATGIVAWLAAAASIVSSASPQAAFRLPLGRRIAVVE